MTVDFLAEHPKDFDEAAFLIATFIRRDAPFLLTSALSLSREGFVKEAHRLLVCVEMEWCRTAPRSDVSPLVEQFNRWGVIASGDRLDMLLRAVFANLNGARFETDDLINEVKTYWRAMGCPDGIPMLR